MNENEKDFHSALIDIADVKCASGIFIIPTGAIEPHGVYYEFYTDEELRTMSKEDLRKAQERVDAAYSEMYSPFDGYDYFI